MSRQDANILKVLLVYGALILLGMLVVGPSLPKTDAASIAFCLVSGLLMVPLGVGLIITANHWSRGEK